MMDMMVDMMRWIIIEVFRAAALAYLAVVVAGMVVAAWFVAAWAVDVVLEAVGGLV